MYDGQFFRGQITATVRARNGRTVGQQIPNGPGGARASAQPATPSLAKRLQSDAKTLARLQAQVRAARRAPASKRSAVLHGGSFPMIVQGLAQIRGAVAAERARLAYIASHPGLLPAE